MHSWILVCALAALTLNVALALPVKQNDSKETADTDEQLIQLLETNSLEAESLEFVRRRRAAGEDDSSPEDTKEDDDHKEKKENKDNKSDSSASGSSEETKQTGSRHKRSTSEDKSLEKLMEQAASDDGANDPLAEDYVQGCEVLEENSKEVNNETFTE